MPPPNKVEARIFVFGELEFDEERWELRRCGEVVDVPPKVMQTLDVLLRSRERVVSNEELIAELWPNVTVTEASLTKAIRIARQVLGDDGDAQAYIKTTRGRGYRFVAAVVERAPSHRATAPSIPPPPLLPTLSAAPTRLGFPQGDEPFVGRDVELAELDSCFDRALAGRPSFALVSGEAGAGKTRLVEVFARAAEARGARVLWGRSVEEGGAPELWPWAQILRSVLETEGMDGEAVSEITRLIAGTRRTDEPEPSTARTDAERFRVFAAVARVLSFAAKKGPLLVVLEDLHAADDASLSLTRFLGRDIRDGGIVVLGTYRPGEVGAVQSEAFKKLVRSTRVIALSGLAEDATRRLMEESLGTAPDAQVLSRVQQVTDGNPLFVAEVVRQLATAAASSRSGAPARDLEIPGRIVEAIRARLDALPVASRELLSVASVVGRQFELPILERVSEAASDALGALLEPAALRGIVAPVNGSLGVCQFTHMLLRDVLYDGLPLARRAELHRRTGEAVEACAVAGVEPAAARLAHHFLRATLGAGSEKAVTYSAAAGRQALRSFAFEEAARHFEHALDRLRFEPGHEGRSADLLLGLGAAQRRAGEYARARESLDRALSLARGLGDPVRFAKAALDYAEVQPESGEVNQVLASLLEEAARLLAGSETRPEHQELQSLVDARLATCAVFAGRKEEGEALSRRALSTARSINRPHVLAHALHARHWLLWRPGTARERLAVASEMVRLERPDRDGLPAMEARLCEITDLLELGDAEALFRALSRYERVAQALRDPSGLYNVRVFETMRAILEGRFGAAERTADEALPVGLRIHPDNARNFYGAHLWWTRVEQGRAAEVEIVFRQRLESQPSSVIRASLLRIYVEADALAEARRELDLLLDAGLATLPDDWSLLPILAHVATACHALGDDAAAARARALLLPHADCHVVLGPAIVYLGPVTFYLGLLSLALSSFGDAVQWFERAIEQAGALGGRPLVARARLHLAEAAAKRGGPGDLERALTAVTDAATTSRELGMAAVERRASALHERLGSAFQPGL